MKGYAQLFCAFWITMAASVGAKEVCLDMSKKETYANAQTRVITDTGRLVLYPFMIENLGKQYVFNSEVFAADPNDTVQLYFFPFEKYSNACAKTGQLPGIEKRDGDQYCYDPDSFALMHCIYGATFEQATGQDDSCFITSLTVNVNGTFNYVFGGCTGNVTGLHFVVAAAYGESTNFKETDLQMTFQEYPQGSMAVVIGALVMVAIPILAFMVTDLLNQAIQCKDADDELTPQYLCGGTMAARLTTFKANWDWSNNAPRFFGLLLLMSASNLTMIFLYVATSYRNFRSQGNRDVCFYNEKCYYAVWGIDLPMNNMISHLGYFTTAVHLFMTTASAELYLSERTAKSETIWPDLSMFYAIALAIFLEGFGSMSYHVCPTDRNFQLDTLFMIPIANLSMLALFHISGISGANELAKKELAKKGQAKPTEADNEGGAVAMLQEANSFMIPEGPPKPSKEIVPISFFIFITCAQWAFSAAGTYLDEHGLVDTPAYWIFAALVIAWGLAVNISSTSALHGQNDGPGSLCIFIGFQVLLLVALLATVFLHDFRNSTMGGFPNSFLIISIVMMLFMNFYNIYFHDLQQEFPPQFNCLQRLKKVLQCMKWYSLGFMSVPVAHFAMYYFTTRFSDYTVSAALSRNLNHVCIWSVFDNHDVWHLLSAIGLGLFAKLLLYVKCRLYNRELRAEQLLQNNVERGLSLLQDVQLKEVKL